MTLFVVLVVVIATQKLLISEVYPHGFHPKHCSFADSQHCNGSLDNPSTMPPTSICCDELKQYRTCFLWPRIYWACHIEFNDFF